MFALRYNCPLHTAICYRIGLANGGSKSAMKFPRAKTAARSIEEIMRDVNRAFEVAVRRDPANWFWVHKRWKPLKTKAETGSIETAA